MPAPARVTLGPATTNRKWYLDVNTGTTATPIWTPVAGIESLNPKRDSNLEDDSDFDSGGFESSTKTTEKWELEVSLVRKTGATLTSYDVGQEFLRTKSYGSMGVANSAEIRYYEMEPSGPRVEAYQGRAAVSFTEKGGNMKALSMADVKLTGQGRLSSITHPDL